MAEAARTTAEIHTWHAGREELHARRAREAWEEYLRTVRGVGTEAYAQAESLGWRRLRRTLAELSHDRRRDEFERDRMIAELSGKRMAA